MCLLIGTDEAGYGPNLGPLTICGTAWEVPSADVELYDLLAEVISAESSSAGKMSICDSKVIYNSAHSIAKLETFVLAVLYACHHAIPHDLGELANFIGADLRSECPGDFSWASKSLQLPLAADPERVVSFGKTFSQECKRVGVKLVKVDCHSIFPSEFNNLVAKFGNKAELLSYTTLNCVKCLAAISKLDAHIVCDKHGGRSKYAPLINQYLTDQFLRIGLESRAASRYAWNENDGRGFAIEFRSKGESFMPTALSSMIAKYFREVCMEVWNRFWQLKIPNIKPTKGYPVDARRFKNEIAAVQSELGIGDESIWRMK